MNDRECVELLQWALPRLGLRWRGFKNLRRPFGTLGLGDTDNRGDAPGEMGTMLPIVQLQ